MRIRLLGRVGLVRDDEAPVELSAPKRRAVLSILALELNREVPTAQLIEAVWGPEAPATAKAALQGHVAALRKILASDLSLVTGRVGYRLEGRPDQVDLHRFRALCRQARQTSAGEAAELLRQALALWVGAALTDCGSVWLLEAWKPRLEQERSQAEASLADLADAAEPRAAEAHRRPEPARAPRGFTGRSRELRQLDRLLAEPDAGPILLTGPAGVGKTSLVLHWARLRRDWFPEGQLFVNLRGFDETEPLTEDAAAGALLLALGTPPPQLPDTVEARRQRLGELLNGRRVMVVLDNVRSADQICDLLPVLQHHRVVATSRNRLEDLVVAQDARPLQLAVPEPAEARRLLTEAVGDERVANDADVLDRIVELCDRLPLALRIVAARLATRPNWVLADVAEQLADERARLPSLSTSGSISVTAALVATCRTLPAATVRLLALTGLHPGREIDSRLAAALAGTSLHKARGHLDRLTRAHLLEEVRPGAFARHDLVRLHTHELAAGLPLTQASIAVSRMVEQYLATAWEASRAVCNAPTQNVSPPAGSVLQFDDHAAATDWFLGQEPAIRLLISATGSRLDDSGRARLGCAIGNMYNHVGRLRTEWSVTAGAALAAAERLGDRSAQGVLLSDIGANLHSDVERHPEGGTALRRAMELFETSGTLRDRVRGRGRYANYLARIGESERSIALQRETVELVAQTGENELMKLILNNLAYALLLDDRADEALPVVERLLRIPSERDYPVFHDTHADILHRLGRHDEALRACLRSLDLAAEQESTDNRLSAIRLAGDILLALGRRPEAEHYWRDALTRHEAQNLDTADLEARLAGAAQQQATDERQDVGGTVTAGRAEG